MFLVRLVSVHGKFWKVEMHTAFGAGTSATSKRIKKICEVAGHGGAFLFLTQESVVLYGKF